MRDSHLSDEELLLSADGELPWREAASARAHLVSCWHCRTRMAELETTIADFTHAYQSTDGEAPPIDGPRALLKARMEQARGVAQARGWLTFRSAAAVLALLVAAFGVVLAAGWMERQGSGAGYLARSTPRPALTPGAIRIATREELCAAGGAETPRGISPSLRRRVFQEYGMSQARAAAFEVDYLVTPELGGAEDIRNLWPQPYTAVWNAHVKDALEDRLHAMVCSGEIDLATAQHDIASDWITAYKKYFHTEQPF